MSDNEDLLGDDLGDQSLADYNLGNEEEEQLLADDYDNGGPQNVPTSIGMAYGDPMDILPREFSGHVIEYNNQPMQFQAMAETECVVPNITVEVPNAPLPERPTYAPYEPRYEQEHAVPPAIPQSSIESPQIVPSDINAPVPNGEMGGPRERFLSERPAGQRMPQIRDIPDSLDKVVIPRGGFPMRGRTSWRSPQFAARYSHPYRRNNVHRGNFQRASYPPPQIRPTQMQIRPEVRPEIRHEVRPEIRHEVRPEIRSEIPDVRPEIRPDVRSDLPPEMRPEVRPDMHPEMRPDIRTEMRPDIRPEMRPEMRPDIRPEMRPDIRPEMRPDIRPEMRPDIRSEMRPDIRPEMRPDIRPDMRPNIRPDMRLDIRPEVHPDMRPDIRLEPPQMGLEISPERAILPQEMPLYRPPGERPPFPYRFQYRPEERQFRPSFEPRPMYFRPGFPRPGFAPIREIAPNTNHLPQVTIRQALPMGMDKGPKMGGPREPEVRMLPVALPPTLPPGGLAGKKVLINPHFKGNFQPPVEGPVKDIDDAAERFIAEQRNALARAANRKYARRSPQRYIENTTIEIQNELAQPVRRRSDDELSRRQEEFINANRAGLRRRMRSPSPVRRSPSPRRSPERRPRNEPARNTDEEIEYKRRLREQESLRERVLRAKEVRRRKNAVALHKQLMDKDRENQEKETPQKPAEPKVEQSIDKPSSTVTDNKPDTTRNTPDTPPHKDTVEKRERVRERSPVKKEESVEVNSTCENLTPPRACPLSPERALTPPLPPADSDDDLDLILGDIDGILSDDEDSGRFKEKNRPEPPKTKPQVDLRSKLPPKTSAESKKSQRQKIVFEEKKKKEKTPPRRPVVTSSTKTDDAENIEKKTAMTTQKADAAAKSRARITYKEAEKEDAKATPFSNRRVILQRKVNQTHEKSVFSRIEVKADPTKPNPGIFSRAVRTAIGTENTRIVVKKTAEPEVEFASDSEVDEDKLLEDVGNVATVANLPHGMTDTRLKTLAGTEVQM